MSNLTYFQQKPQIQCNFNGQKYELYRLNDQEYHQLHQMSLSIDVDPIYLMKLEQYFEIKKEKLNLAQINVILTVIAGETRKYYDDWKSSFCFPFALKIENNSRILDNYMLTLCDWRGHLDFQFQRLVSDTEISQGMKRDIIKSPFPEELSEDDIKDLILYLHTYFINYFEKNIKEKIDLENFFKSIDSNLILYGYQDGEFWQENYTEEGEYMQKIEELKSKGIKETFTIDKKNFNSQTKEIEQGIKEGIEIGAKKAAKEIINRLIKRQLGEISSDMKNRIDQLSIDNIRILQEELFDFQNKDDLINWLNNHN